MSEEKRGKGRPKLKEGEENPAKLIINWDKVDNMLVAGMSGVQVAATIGVSLKVLYTRVKKERGMGWAHYAQEKLEKGNGMIHVAQFEKAINGKNTDMLKHLGRFRLNQTERLIVDHNDAGGVQVYLPDNGMKVNDKK